jgi:hypothetical protein
VQLGEWPRTKWETALLYPAVLLCSLKRKVRVALEKYDLFQTEFSFRDESKSIIVSVLLENFTKLCGTNSKSGPIIFFLYRLQPFTLRETYVPMQTVFLSFVSFLMYFSLAFEAIFLGY